MAIDSQTIRDLAELARLQLSDTEIERARLRIAALLESFDSIATIDTFATPAFDAGARLVRARDDRPAPAQDRESTLAAAPRSQHGQFVVPRAVEG